MKKLPVTLSKTEFMRGIALLIAQQLVIPQLLAVSAAVFHITPSAATLNFTYFFINYLCTILLFRNFLWAELDTALNNTGRILSSAAIGYGVYYVLSTVIVYLIDWIDPAFSNLNDDYIGAMSQQQFALMAVGTVIFVPPAEELLFRGVLFNYFYKKRPFLACIISIVSFSLIHLIGYIGQYTPLSFFLAFLQYLPASIALCFAYIRSGTIFAPILIHTFVNAIAMYYQFTMR